MNEIWKDVIGYEGLYQVSDLGNVKHLEWESVMPQGHKSRYKEKQLKPAKNHKGYLMVGLCKDGILKLFAVHRIVWQSFNGKTILQVDHIAEGNKTDNRLCNLQTVTNRQNTTKHRTNTIKSSNYTGVTWAKKCSKWKAQIQVNKKTKHLGYFINELDASNAYQKALSLVYELPENLQRC